MKQNFESTQLYQTDDFLFRAPTHAGGLLAVDRKFFFEMGGYDPGLKIWGGENFELAFKVRTSRLYPALFYPPSS